MMRTWLPVLLIALPACFAPPGPMERLTNSAYDCNMALRFNRKGIAAGYSTKEAHADFVERHAKWGHSIRIVDVEMAGMRMVTTDTAEVVLSVSWHRVDEAVIRFSQINQHWTEDRDGWRLAEEMRSGGSPGLFDRPKRSGKGQRDDAPELRVDLGQL
jgi:hypothetical protein